MPPILSLCLLNLAITSTESLKLVDNDSIRLLLSSAIVRISKLCFEASETLLAVKFASSVTLDELINIFSAIFLALFTRVIWADVDCAIRWLCSLVTFDDSSKEYAFWLMFLSNNVKSSLSLLMLLNKSPNSSLLVIVSRWVKSPCAINASDLLADAKGPNIIRVVTTAMNVANATKINAI